MFKEVMNDLWLARISSLSNEVGLYVVLLEVVNVKEPRHSKLVTDYDVRSDSTVYDPFQREFSPHLTPGDAPIRFVGLNPDNFHQYVKYTPITGMLHFLNKVFKFI
jgi:hypothetical protein